MTGEEFRREHRALRADLAAMAAAAVLPVVLYGWLLPALEVPFPGAVTFAVISVELFVAGIVVCVRTAIRYGDEEGDPVAEPPLAPVIDLQSRRRDEGFSNVVELPLHGTGIADRGVAPTGRGPAVLLSGRPTRPASLAERRQFEAGFNDPYGWSS